VLAESTVGLKSVVACQAAAVNFSRLGENGRAEINVPTEMMRSIVE